MGHGELAPNSRAAHFLPNPSSVLAQVTVPPSPTHTSQLDFSHQQREVPGTVAHPPGRETKEGALLGPWMRAQGVWAAKARAQGLDRRP